MYLTLNYRATLVMTLTLLSACTPKDGGDSDPSTGSTSASDPSASETGGEPTASGTEPDLTTTATDSAAGESETTTATDGAVSETDATDTSDEETAGDETGQVWPSECVEIDPAVAAGYTLEVVGWPVLPEETGELVDAPCSVDAVTDGGETISTALTCEIDGAPHAAILTIAASPEGPIDWAMGDQVELSTEIWDEGDHGHGRNIQLRAADDALLLSASDAILDEYFIERFSPLTVELVYACSDPNTTTGNSPLRVDFKPVDGPIVGVFSGQRGVMPIDAAAQFAIDVEKAIADPSHKEGEMKVLLRRVKLGE
jgi:hypothetical protein